MLTKSETPKLKEIMKSLKPESNREVKAISLSILFNDDKSDNCLTLAHGYTDDVQHLIAKQIKYMCEANELDISHFEDETKPADENL